MTYTLAVPFRNLASSLLTAIALAGEPHPVAVTATLSEWKVELSERRIAPGVVTFTVMDSGSIPHGFEVEGEGIEQETKVIQPGATATLTLTLKPGTYEVYCPVGEDSHKKLGMDTRLRVEGGERGDAMGTTAPAINARDSSRRSRMAPTRTTSRRSRARSPSPRGTRARCAIPWTAMRNSRRRTAPAGSSCSTACRRRTCRTTRASVV